MMDTELDFTTMKVTDIEPSVLDLAKRRGTAVDATLMKKMDIRRLSTVQSSVAIWAKRTSKDTPSPPGSNASSSSSSGSGESILYISPSVIEAQRSQRSSASEPIEGSSSSRTSFTSSSSGSISSSEYSSSSAASIALSSERSEDEDTCSDPDPDDFEALLRCLLKSKEGEHEEDYFKEQPNFDEIDTYEEYLDHFVHWKDLYYFDSEEIARLITALGFRVPELLNRQDFEKKMLEIRIEREEKRKDDAHLAYDVGLENITCPLMQALAEREVKCRTGNLSTIFFIRTFNAKKQEVSAWIDFRVRLQDDEKMWHAYYTGQKKLMPRPTDLCYYNWSTFKVCFNSSDDYLVTTDIKKGLQFMNKLDRKLISVNPKTPPGDNTYCYMIKSPNYEHCLLYDHFLRVKA